MPGDRQFEEDEGLNAAHVELHHIVREPQQQQGFAHADQPQHRGYRDDAPHVPAHRLRIDRSAVVGDGHDGHIVEKGQQNDHHRSDGVEVVGQHGRHHEHHDANGFSDAVDGVAVHALENAPRLFHRLDDGGQPRRGENERGGRACRVGGARDGDAHIGLFQRGGIVDAVAGHGHAMPRVLQRLDDAVFVFGEDLGEAVGGIDLVGQTHARLLLVGVEYIARGHDLRADTELPADFAGNRHVVAGDHLYRQSVAAGVGDGLSGVAARRVEQRE